MNNPWQKYAETAAGLTELTRQRAEQVVRGLVKQGEVAADRAEKTVDDLLQRSERNRRALTGLVRTETERAVQRLGLVPAKEVERLRDQVRRLERQLAEERGGQAGGGPAQKTGKKTGKKTAKKSAAAKRSSAAKSAKKSTKKSGGAKRTAKKSAAAKKSAKKTGGAS